RRWRSILIMSAPSKACADLNRASTAATHDVLAGRRRARRGDLWAFPRNFGCADLWRAGGGAFAGGDVWGEPARVPCALARRARVREARGSTLAGEWARHR